MKYTIKQVSEMTGLPIPTLRYYDKEGLLPALEHKDSGYRVFHDIDIQNIEVIECFKKTGMAIKDIREYMELFFEGASTWEQRRDMFQKQLSMLMDKRTEIEEAIQMTEKKLVECQKAVDNGTEEELRQLLLRHQKKE